ncbi:MAG: holo-ACP synthase [Firmicutes bacterium]|nr:holo-ACP synthase [Bacillota bacterium]
MYCGVDMIEIDRIVKTAANPRFLTRLYAPEEIRLIEAKSGWRKAEVIAGRFAAKEAVIKVLLAANASHTRALLRGVGHGHSGAMHAREIATLTQDGGAPHVYLTGETASLATSLGLTHIAISLSHTKTHAVAFAIGT